MRIEDGLGKGKFLKIDEENRAETKSTTIEEYAHVAEVDGLSFIMATPALTITTTGGIVAHFINNESSRNFVLNRAYLSYNGNSSTFNRCCLTTLYINTSLPTGASTAGSIRNSSSASAQTTSSTWYYWDETGDGMTVASNGLSVGTLILGQGAFQLPFQGGTIIAPGVSLGIHAKSEAAAGEFSVIVTGYFK